MVETEDFKNTIKEMTNDLNAKRKELSELSANLTKWRSDLKKATDKTIIGKLKRDIALNEELETDLKKEVENQASDVKAYNDEYTVRQEQQRIQGEIEKQYDEADRFHAGVMNAQE